MSVRVAGLRVSAVRVLLLPKLRGGSLGVSCSAVRWLRGQPGVCSLACVLLAELGGSGVRCWVAGTYCLADAIA